MDGEHSQGFRGLAGSLRMVFSPHGEGSMVAHADTFQMSESGNQFDHGPKYLSNYSHVIDQNQNSLKSFYDLT